MITLKPFFNQQVLVTEKADGDFRSETEVKNYLRSQQISAPICYFHHQHQAQRYICQKSELANEHSIWADSVITKQNICLAMLVADCLPVLLVDQKTGCFALVHCGWKPLLQNILELTILDMKQNFSTEPENLSAWLGPGIHACCYRFSQKPVQANLANWEKAVNLVETQTTEDKEWQINLPLFIKQELSRLGLTEQQVLNNSQCTGCNSNFFSHHAAHTKQAKKGRFIVATWRT